MMQMCSMLMVLVLINVGGSLASNVMCITGNNTGSKLTFEPYTDGVAGRYLVKLCTDPKPKVTAWMLTLMYYDTDKPCNHPSLFNRLGTTHSTFKESVVMDANCSQVCLRTTFDLVFSKCYAIQNFFVIDDHLRPENFTYFNIKNNLTREEIDNNTALVDIENYDDNNIVVWHTGVAFDSYEMRAFRMRNKSGETWEDSTASRSWSGEECETRTPTEVRCPVELEEGCYTLYLTLYASWTHGIFKTKAENPYEYCAVTPPDPQVSGSSLSWVWAMCGVLALSAVCVAAGVTCCTREARAWNKAVQAAWQGQRRAHVPTPKPVKSAQKHVMLLYAREGPYAARVTAALRELLQLSSATRVYDIFSTDVMSMAAAAPGEWIRGMLQRDDVTVVLLQTPALECLYQSQLQDADNGVTLVEPLLGRRVVYRAPQYGDSLLQYATRLTAEAAHAQSNYHKYYIAQISDLPTEIFPQLVPYRRYTLPTYAAALVHDVCDVTPPDHLLAAFGTALREFVDHARDNPNYLMDELMFL